MQRITHLPWHILPAWALGKRLKILMYHSISANPLDPHAISPEQFKIHMQSLQSKKVISLMDGISFLQSSRSLHNVYVITFDDALLDFYHTAIPLLSEFGYPVTMFVPTGLVGCNAAWDSYDKSKPLMTWEQMEECQKYNVFFGSHTSTHAYLPGCSDHVLRDELTVSLNTLQDKLRQTIPAIAYPGGYHDERIRRAACESGYICGLGASSHWGNGYETDLFQLHRELLNQ
jgi:peptidoglycan/xylan/chitin deacetylase (PgdA/CDA1 family)